MKFQLDSFTYQEIISQPEVLKATLSTLHSYQDEIRLWLHRPRDQVIFTGCGSTHYLSLHAAAAWQALTGTTARGLPASELWLFPEIYLTEATYLLVAVSRSALTTETIRAVKTFYERAGDNCIVITCYADRELSKAAAHVLVAEKASEESMAQTRSFTSMMLSALYLAGVAAGRQDFLEELDELPEILRGLFHDYQTQVARVGRDLDIEHIVFLGSGANYGIACEAMIKMKEMTLSSSEAFHFLEFRHGPKSVVGTDTMVVGLVGDSAGKEEAAVLAEMRELGAMVVTIAETVDDLPGDEKIALNSGVGELARGVLALPLLQLMACHRAAEKGLNPDRPKNLTTVVHLN